ncbi:MAG: spore coat protein [Firmicutes bacterium]|nr:spore coat protein [Bacillota bacterium]
MPKLTPAELLSIHEIADSLATDVAKLTAYQSFVDDPHLSTMLHHAYQKAQAHYQELIDLASGESLDRRFENMDGGLSGRPKGLPQQAPSPVRPQVQAGFFSARTIAADCLSCAKNMAIRTIWAATEASHVGLRRAFSEMSRFYLDSAYEFFRYMEQKGWYVPLEANESAERWFQQNHSQRTVYGEFEPNWVRPADIPS